jgi:hypothetical protein
MYHQFLVRYAATVLQRHLLGACVLLTLWCALAIAALGTWICLSGVPYVRGVEINVVLTVQKALMGRPLYTNPEDMPFDVAQYNPLYYLVCLGHANLAGIRFDEPAELLLLCRAISLVCAFLITVLCYAFATRNLGLRRAYGVMCAAFAFVATSPWFFLARPDALMCLTLLAGFVCAVKSASLHGVAAYVYGFAAIVFCLLSACAKQNGVQAVVIVLVYFWFIRQYGKCLVTFAACAVLGGIGYLFFAHVYPALIPNVVGGVDNGVSFHNAISKTYSGFFSNYALVLGLAGLAVVRWAAAGADVRRAFFVVSLPLLLLFALVTGLKTGSAEGYFNEFLIVASLAIGCFVQDSVLVGSPEKGRESATLLASVAAAYMVCFLPFWSLVQVRQHWWQRLRAGGTVVVPENSLWSREYYGVGPQLRDELQSDDAFVLSFNLALNSYIPSRCVVPQGPLAGLLYNRGVFDFASFRRLVDDGHVKFVVMDAGKALPEDFLGARITGRYVMYRQVGNFEVYRFQKTRNETTGTGPCSRAEKVLPHRWAYRPSANVLFPFPSRAAGLCRQSRTERGLDSKQLTDQTMDCP